MTQYLFFKDNKDVNKFLIIFIAIIIFAFGVIVVSSNQKQGMLPSQDKTVNEEKKLEGYLGKVLAGSSSPFLEFNKKDYEKALKSDKIIFLDFYANWCPICRAEEPLINDGFSSLTENRVIGFRVNFNDSDTDEDEKKLAKDFNVPYQHTKVFLKNGEEISRSVDQWDKKRFLEEISNHSN